MFVWSGLLVNAFHIAATFCCWLEGKVSCSVQPFCSPTKTQLGARVDGHVASSKRDCHPSAAETVDRKVCFIIALASSLGTCVTVLPCRAARRRARQSCAAWTRVWKWQLEVRGETLAPSLLSAHTRVQRLLLSCCNCCYLCKAADTCLLPPCASSLHFCPSFCIVFCLMKMFYEIPFPVFKLIKIKSLLLNILCER